MTLAQILALLADPTNNRLLYATDAQQFYIVLRAAAGSSAIPVGRGGIVVTTTVTAAARKNEATYASLGGSLPGSTYVVQDDLPNTLWLLISADVTSDDSWAALPLGLPGSSSIATQAWVSQAYATITYAENLSDAFSALDSRVSGTEGRLTSLEGSTKVVLPLALSDEDTLLTTGTSKVTYHMPAAFTLTDVVASVTTAPTGSNLIVDVNVDGASILSTKVSIDAGEETSLTAASQRVISAAAMASGAKVTFDIDQIGSTIAGKGLKISLIGTWTWV